MIFLVKDSGKVRAFNTEAEMKAAGFNKAGLKVTEEVYNSNGCYARIVEGNIVVGKTEDEIAEQERQEQIAEYLGQLEAIDRQAGAGRAVRGLALATAEQAGINNDDYERLSGFEEQAEAIRGQLGTLLNQ